MSGYDDGTTLGPTDIDTIKERTYAQMVSWKGEGATDEWKRLVAQLLEYQGAQVDATVLHGGFSGRFVKLLRLVVVPNST